VRRRGDLIEVIFEPARFQFHPPAARLQQVVHRDPIEPRGEGAVAAKGAQRGDDPDEDLLRQIFGVRPAAEHLQGDVEHQGLVTHHQGVQRLPIAVERAGDQLPIVIREAHTWCSPPSTQSSVPFTYELAALARKSAALATSSAFPQRASGIWAVIWAPAASSVACGRPSLPQSGVSMAPGHSALTRMFRGASSAAATRTSDRSAAFVILATLAPAKPIRFRNDVVTITEAP